MTRSIAFDLLQRVQDDDAYANLLLPALVRRAGLDTRDAGFVQELAFGTLRNRLLYQEILQRASSRKLTEIEPAAELVLLLGVHQILEMRVPTHAAINETVNLAKGKASKGSVGFVNAVLRKVAERSKAEWVVLVTSTLGELEALAVQYSHPLWMVKAFKSALMSRGAQDELEDLLASNNTPARVSLVALPGFSDRADLSEPENFGPASPLGVEVTGNPSNIEAVRLGNARVQDQGSQLMVLALLASELECEDSSWLDLCAGPGGKAALLAAHALKQHIELVCNEILPHRAELVKNVLKPLGQLVVTTSDGRSIGAQNRKYSRILLDAPCTGLGSLRRRPESRWRKTPADLVSLTALQRELFASAWSALQPGGVLGYVTCSPHLSETAAMVSWAEAQFSSQLELVNANEILNSINPGLGLDASLRTSQLWPHTHGTDAMFLALFRKSVS